jgi:hypothetical protein
MDMNVHMVRMVLLETFAKLLVPSGLVAISALRSSIVQPGSVPTSEALPITV